MNYYGRILGYFLTVALFVVFFSACSTMEPPDITVVEDVFQECYDDIQIVVDYLMDSEYESISIDADSRSGLKDTDGYHIESVELVLDSKTEEAVQRLLCGEYEHIDKIGNTIEIVQWNWLNDVSCGVAFTINAQDLPEIQYVTELTPMKEDGWYYYVADFNQWRLEHT